MTITETDIRQWADHHECRSNLPVLIRRLIRETNPSVSSLRFPGHESVDLAGLDGRAEAAVSTRWVPQGRSVWEMGCDQKPKTKADGDYTKRTAQTPQEERGITSFIFITPRRWAAKDKWLKQRRDENSWAGVYAYDAVDLETWLEEAPVTSLWLSGLLGVTPSGLMIPHEWWQRWATAAVPPISMRLVATRRHDEQQRLLEKLRNSDHVISVQADDRKEAVAFVVATMTETNALDLLDRTLVATSGKVRITIGSTRLIIIADVTENEEPDFGDRRNITIVRPYPKGRFDVHDALQLGHIPSEVFRSELETMGLSRDEAQKLALQTGHSVPVLRRQLSADPEIRRPIWARDRVSAKRLLPFALGGAWLERKDLADSAILELLGQLDKGAVERIRDDLLLLDDAPVARYGNANVVVSQLDAIFAVGPFIEQDDLDRFFQLVPELLGDRDPALDLPQDQWWMANVLGKARSCSGALLSGLGDALCILSVHGAEICGNRLHSDYTYRVEQIVRSLMQNASEERWLTIRGHLRALAEASPNVFLDCLEEELRRREPSIRAIMGTTGGSTGGECLRTNLLWALEMLAWHPTHFSRVAQIIFELQHLETKDNWSNSSKLTAHALFLAWLPATALSVSEKAAALRSLAGRFRSPAMDVCVSLLPSGLSQFASRTVRPKWRALEAEVPEPTNEDVREAAIEASRLLLDLAPFDKSELKILLEAATRLHLDDLKRLVGAVEQWADNTNDEDKAELRNDLRRYAVMRAYQKNDGDEEEAIAFHRMEAALEPDTPTARHRWLFENPHINWPEDVKEDGEGQLSWEEGEARAQQLRLDAVAEIEHHIGKEQILNFALTVKHPELVAQSLVSPGAGPVVVSEWIERLFNEPSSGAADAFLRQLIWSAGLDNLAAVVSHLHENGVLNSEDKQYRLAKNLPGNASGWSVAENMGGKFAATYWDTVSIRVWKDTSAEEVAFAIERLLNAQRSRSAFFAACFCPDRVAPEQWVRIIQAIACGEEPGGPFPDAYHLNKVLELLDAAGDVSNEQIAGLELPFVPLLCNRGHPTHKRVLALHCELASNPACFVQLLCWRYRRRDGVDDPEQETLSPEQKKNLADIAYHTLEGWNTVPGCRDDGKVDPEQFVSWAEDAFHRAAEVSRKEVAENHFGGLLARFARRRSWDDWLPECVLAFLDKPENGSLREKFEMGVRNARGVTMRGPYDGGAQERQLAARYRELATRYRTTHPRVSVLLSSTAESYEQDARRQDEEAAVGERWHP